MGQQEAHIPLLGIAVGGILQMAAARLNPTIRAENLIEARRHFKLVRMAIRARQTELHTFRKMVRRVAAKVDLVVLRHLFLDVGRRVSS
ncbi:hypothetical protein D9M69_633720 [compost metagenome]